MLCLVPTPIGNLEDISKRSLKALLEAELIFCEDTRVTKKLLNLLALKYELDFSQKEFKSFHSHNEKEILKNLTKLYPPHRPIKTMRQRPFAETRLSDT